MAFAPKVPPAVWQRSGILRRGSRLAAEPDGSAVAVGFSATGIFARLGVGSSQGPIDALIDPGVECVRVKKVPGFNLAAQSMPHARMRTMSTELKWAPKLRKGRPAGRQTGYCFSRSADSNKCPGAGFQDLSDIVARHFQVT
jgi:hypothetical protein